MILKIERRVLSDAISVVLPGVPSRTTKDICKSIKLTVSKGQLSLTATDLEATIIHKVDCESEGGIEALLPAARVSSILRELPEGSITLSVDDGKLTIVSAAAEFVLATENPRDYPEATGKDIEGVWIVKREKLLDAIRRVSISLDVDSTRYALGGAQLTLRNDDGDNFTFASTDSRRLTIIGSLESGAHLTGVIPAKVLGLIERMAGDAEIRIAMDANHIAVWSDTTTIRGRLLEGRFPQWRDVIPKQFNHEISLPVASTLSAIRQAMIVQNPESKGVDFAFDAGTLTLKSTASDIGTSKVDLPIGYDGPPLSILFDPRYIADFLKLLHPGGVATLHIVDENGAALFTSGADHRYIVMPLAKD